MVNGTESAASTQWYAIQTKVRYEQIARQQLLSRDIETFLPTTARWSRWKDRRKRIESALFPGYCFARFNLGARVRVLECSGVSKIVSVNGHPEAVPDCQLNSIRLLVEGAVPFDPCSLLPEGTKVEIMGGPLRGVVGHVLRTDRDRATVVLTVDAIQRALRVEVAAEDVCPI